MLTLLGIILAIFAIYMIIKRIINLINLVCSKDFVLGTLALSIPIVFEPFSRRDNFNTEAFLTITIIAIIFAITCIPKTTKKDLSLIPTFLVYSIAAIVMYFTNKTEAYFVLFGLMFLLAIKSNILRVPPYAICYLLLICFSLGCIAAGSFDGDDNGFDIDYDNDEIPNDPALMASTDPDLVHVDEYHREDGTYVREHFRTAPDGNPYNNLK